MKSKKSALFLFAPKFREYGADIATDLSIKGVINKVHGICTGGKETLTKVYARLGSCGGDIYDIEAEEINWVQHKADSSTIIKMQEELGYSIVGRTITSDRRIGAGFVFGGVARPSWLKAASLQNPLDVPINYVANLYKFLDKTLQDKKPYFVFLYAVAGAPAFLLSQMCLARGILVLRPNATRIGSLTVIDTDPLGRLACIKNTFDNVSVDSLIYNKHESWAQQYLEDYRCTPTLPEYKIYNDKVRSKNKITKVLYGACRQTTKSFVKDGVRGLLSEPVQRHWHATSLAWKRAFYKKDIFKNFAPDNYRWVYFPLHVDPEASTMVLSPWHTNQVAVIEALAKSLPADAILVVKEHLPMLGVRPKGFYEIISKIPRVVLISPLQKGLWWVKKSSLTVVITGTAALEAIMLRKPALVIGDSPFLSIGDGIMHAPCLSQLHEKVDLALSMKPASDESIIRYLCAVKENSFDWKPSIMWGDYLKHTEAQQKEAVSQFSDHIERYL
ncbi:hypothetical protein ACUY1T_00060 [Billgrantia sp. Q4P2]|uniref:hypothetical protein n=1 Tax=Billgrantia sp. Q4P2 TaxID=3463857 RepID=UPI004057636B